MPSILLCWPTTSEVDVGGMAAEVQPSHQYPITFWCCVKDGNREAAWQNGVWHGRAYEAKVCQWIPSRRKNGIYRHALMLAEHLWRSNSGCEHTEAVCGALQQWWHWQWVTSTDRDCYKHGMEASFTAGEKAQPMVVTVLKKCIW